MPRARKLPIVVGLKHAKRIRTNLRKRISMNMRLDKFIYPFRQYCDDGLLTYSAVTSSALVDNVYAWQFTAAMIPQFATFAALYDVYSIKLIEFTIRPRYAIETNPNASSMGTVAQRYLSNYIVVVDHDDANLPTNYNALREYNTAREYYDNPAKVKKIVFKPAVAQIIYNNGITTANSERFSPWIDCANPNVPHYGVKMALPVNSTANFLTMDISVRYLIEFKHVR